MHSAQCLRMEIVAEKAISYVALHMENFVMIMKTK